jgi:hypothetical protein
MAAALEELFNFSSARLEENTTGEQYSKTVSLHTDPYTPLHSRSTTS